MGSLDFSSILICKDDYMILVRPLRRLYFSSRSSIQSSGDHVDDSSSRLIIHCLFNRLGLSVGKRPSRWVPSVLFERASLDEVLYLIFELDALFGGMPVTPMEPAVSSPVEAFCLQRRRPSQIFCSFNFHQDLRTKSREESVGVIPAMRRSQTPLSGRDPSIGGARWVQ